LVGDVSLSGDVTTALSGVDWSSRVQWVRTAVVRSWGSDDYGEGDSSTEESITSSLAGLCRHFLHPQLFLWGVVGYGWGEYNLYPKQGASRSANI